MRIAAVNGKTVGTRGPDQKKKKVVLKTIKPPKERFCSVCPALSRSAWVMTPGKILIIGCHTRDGFPCWGCVGNHRMWGETEQ